MFFLYIGCFGISLSPCVSICIPNIHDRRTSHLAFLNHLDWWKRCPGAHVFRSDKVLLSINRPPRYAYVLVNRHMTVTGYHHKPQNRRVIQNCNPIRVEAQVCVPSCDLAHLLRCRPRNVSCRVLGPCMIPIMCFDRSRFPLIMFLTSALQACSCSAHLSVQH